MSTPQKEKTLEGCVMFRFAPEAPPCVHHILVW